MLLHPPQPSSSLPHFDYPPQHAPFQTRATPRSLSTVDRLSLPHQPPHSADEHHLDDSPLEQPSSYNYVPRGQPVQPSPSPDTMYQHHVHSQLYDDPQNTHSNPLHTHQHVQQQHPNPDYDVQSRQPPPNIHTGELIYPDTTGNFTPSPISPPADNHLASQPSVARQFSFPQPMSAPHTQSAFPPRFGPDAGLARLSFSNPTLDRRMSEPVLGAGRQSYPQPSPAQHHDAFAYSGASSATMVQPSSLSPRPSSSYSSYGAYTEHQRDGSGASMGSTGLSDQYANSIANWGSGSVKHNELEADSAVASSPLSPMYAGSAASGSDVSATGLPSPPIQSLSPSRQSGSVPSARPQPPQAPAGVGATPRPGGGSNSKTYSFVSLPGNAVKKRPRRRYDEIERLYQCSWPNCTKAYGTLNHLNAHVTMQRHGPKRSPNEFKELRKKWRQEKKEAEEAEREREREAAAQAIAMREMHPFGHQQMVDYDHHRFARRRMSMVEPYPDPHGHGQSGGPHSLPNHSYLHSAMQGQGPSPGQVPSFGGQPQGTPAYGSLQGPGMGMDTRYALSSPADEVQQFRYSSAHPSVQGLPSLSMPHHASEEDAYYRQSQAVQSQGDLVGPGWGNTHPSQQAQVGMRPPQQQFYGSQGGITLPPPHALNTLSVSAPNPSPLSGPTFPALGGDLNLGMAGGMAPGGDSGSQTPELAAHVSLGSNRLPPDSTLLTPLPGYEPEGDGLNLGRVRERSRERDRDYGRDDRDRAWDDRSAHERERYYASNGQGNGREQQQYE